ncbi:MAG: gamma-glutamylcyclotransferase, partial [Marivivens sp.]|nr:gamma-glutamylcyclotransferase [Marivivens sp.]
MDLFVFGSLRDPRLFHLIAGEGGTPTETVLPDYRVERVAGTTVPMLVPAVGELAKGVLWRGLSEAQMERLDAYELPWDYSRGSVVIDGIEAGVYFADHPNVASGELWSLETWEQEDGDVSR